MKTEAPAKTPITELTALGPLISTAVLLKAGIGGTALTRLVRSGRLIRLGRGLYMPAGSELPGNWTLQAVATRAPDTLFCLLTALQLHNLTTQSPAEVWIALGNHEHPPRMEYPPLRVIRFAPASLDAGVQNMDLEGMVIRVTGPAKTVADCFKFRNRVGLDVALEALREARRTGAASIDELWNFARVNRVHNIMRPYLEAIS